MILGKCEYDPELRELSIEGQSPQVIGHVQAKLLQLLYSNPDQYFSNDDLQREVWDGRVIENTTIRTTVSYLRKALGESEDCKYIDSGRNKGYRFVADIEEITPQRQFKRFFPFAVIAGLAILLIYVVFQSSPPQVVPKIETTLVGQELEATVSGELMVFSHKPEGSETWNLFSKEIGKERYFRLTDGPFNDRKSALFKNGTHLAFNRHDGEKCQIIVAELTKGKHELINEKSVFSCPNGYFIASLAWQSSSSLYLTLARSMTDKYRLEIFDIETKELTPITTPSSSGRGDYYVTSNESAKKVSYLRNITGNKTEVWVYDEISKQSRIVASIPLILMTAGWISENELVVRTGWGQLSLLDIKNGELQKVFETGDKISYPFVINKSSVGYMNGFLTVRDIVQTELNGNTKNVISSSFRDFNPVYAEEDGSIAFISNRTGKYQIWIRNKVGELTQVTQFDQNLRIGNLTISRNGKYIAFVINAHLQIMRTDGTLLFQSKDGHFNKNPAFSHDSEKVFYASELEGEWYIEYRALGNLKIKNRLDKGYVIAPCAETDCFYYIKHKESLLYKSVGGESFSTGVTLNNIASPAQLKIVGELVYYLNREGKQSELLVQNMMTKEVNHVMPLSTSGFSTQNEPFYVFTSKSREPETLLLSVKVEN
jgi:DNA-binding winged helix-turn-helix (wHTH) protein